ncbi:MAG: hypothetical protein JST17_15465 [Bacteroidetes bacterium]|nr:hypothetical protein [Bacteroidota bacterium]MBS1930583.1 hypothetical protein [Bacteroidota bacterium]
MDTPDLKIKYAVIDDDVIDRTVIDSEAKKFLFLQKAASFSNPVEAL